MYYRVASRVLGLLEHRVLIHFRTTFSDGCLGSISDEGRSEVR